MLAQHLTNHFQYFRSIVLPFSQSEQTAVSPTVEESLTRWAQAQVLAHGGNLHGRECTAHTCEDRKSVV